MLGKLKPLFLPQSGGIWLRLARLAWFLVAGLNLGLFLIALPSSLAAHTQAALRFGPFLGQLGLIPQSYALYRAALDALQVFAFAGIGVVIFLRSRGSKLLIWVSLTLITFGSLFVPTLIAFIERYPAWAYPVGFLRAFGLASSLLVFFYLFPNGRFVPRWSSAAALIWTGLAAFWFLFPTAPYNIVYLNTWSENLPVSVGLLFIWFFTGVLAQAYRYGWVLSPSQRQQIKWAVFGMTIAVSGFALYHLPLVAFPQLAGPSLDGLLYALFAPPVYHLMVLLAPLSIAIAILRYRLWEIDLLINRAMVYTALTGSLALVYFSSIILLQTTFRAFTGQDRSVFVTVISTLLMVVLISPLRQRIQLSIDRRFYRRRYDAQKTLAAFSETMRDEVDLQVLSSRLQAVVEESIQPSLVVLWLKSEGEPGTD